MDAMKVMYENNIRRVIITEGNNLIGILTEHDIFKTLMNRKELLSIVVSGDFPLPHKNINEDLSHFWFNQSFFK